MTGQTLSHYELLEQIGKGGMGVVYKARDTRLDRIVAIKLLPPDKISDADRKRRFVQEAKAASALPPPTSSPFTRSTLSTASTSWSWSTSRARRSTV